MAVFELIYKQFYLLIFFPSYERTNTYTIMLEELNLQEMEEIKGGVSQQEYCATLSELIDNNWNTWSDGERHSAASAYSEHC